ncbi:MAG: hypothetical protein GY857_02195 [Desulfobacula sp.]|nr:hypothetical protein [Desulfobacula sp.]
MLKEVFGRFKIHLFLRPVYFMLGDTHTGLEWKISQQHPMTENTAVSLDLSGKDAFRRHESEELLINSYNFS